MTRSLYTANTFNSTISSDYGTWTPLFCGVFYDAAFNYTGTVKIKEWWITTGLDAAVTPITGSVQIGVRAGRFDGPPSDLGTNIVNILRLDKADWVNTSYSDGLRMRWQNLYAGAGGTAVFEEGSEVHYLNAWNGHLHRIAPLGQEIVLHQDSYWRIEVNAPSRISYRIGVIWEESTG
jgi:hypothetical protein